MQVPVLSACILHFAFSFSLFIFFDSFLFCSGRSESMPLSNRTIFTSLLTNSFGFPAEPGFCRTLTIFFFFFFSLVLTSLFSLFLLALCCCFFQVTFLYIRLIAYFSVYFLAKGDSKGKE